MNLIIRRRQFGQLAIASAATTAIANFAGKSIAQQSDSIVLGFNLTNNKSPVSSLINTTTKLTNALIDTVTDTVLGKEDLIKLSNSTPEINVSAVDSVTGRVTSTVKLLSTTVENLNVKIETASKAVSTAPKERLTGVTAFNSGFVVSSVFSSQIGDNTRLIFLNSLSSTSQSLSLRARNGIKISGLPTANSTIESLLAIKDNQLICVISHNSGIAPFSLGIIDPKTGIVKSGTELALPHIAESQRISNLALAPDGKIYATTLDRDDTTTLVQFDFDNKAIITGLAKVLTIAQLQIEKKPLANDLLSLAFSRSGQLFGLADINNEGTNLLYSINVKTGEIQPSTKFPFAKIAFAG